VILANINLNILMADMQAYAEVLAPNGTIIFSGFYSRDLETLTNEAAKNGLSFMASKQREGWTAAVFVKG